MLLSVRHRVALRSHQQQQQHQLWRRRQRRRQWQRSRILVERVVAKQVLVLVLGGSVFMAPARHAPIVTMPNPAAVLLLLHVKACRPCLCPRHNVG